MFTHRSNLLKPEFNAFRFLIGLFVSLLPGITWAAEPSLSASNLSVYNYSELNYGLSWSYDISFSNAADRYLIVATPNGTPSQFPQDGTTYSVGQSIGSSTVIGNILGKGCSDSGNCGVVTGTNFPKTRLSNSGEDYYITIYPFNEDSANDYRTLSPGQAIFVTPGIVHQPSGQASSLELSLGTYSTTTQKINYSFSQASDAESVPFKTEYLLVMKYGSAPTYIPTDGTYPSSNPYASPVDVGDDNLAILYKSLNGDFTINQSEEERTLYVKVYAYNMALSSYTIYGTYQSSTNFNPSNPASDNITLPATLNNEPPTIADQSFEVDEDPGIDTFIGGIEVTDDNTSNPTLSITAGNDEGYFRLDGSSLYVANSQALDYESQISYELTVEAEDGIGVTSEATITINLININDNDPVFEDVTITTDEEQSVGTVITTLVATDVDEDDLTYHIESGNDAGAFALGETSGELTVNDKAAMDFETMPQFVLEIRVNDGLNNVSSTLTINLNDTEEYSGPDFEVPTGYSFVLNESVENGVFGTVTAIDPDGDDVTYSFTNDVDENLFSLGTSSGELSLLDQSGLDYSLDAYEFMISASDGTESREVLVQVIPSAAPVFAMETNEFSFDEEAAFFLQLAITDPEEEPMTLSIVSGNTDDLLSVANTAGIFSSGPVWEVYPTNSVIDFETITSFDIVISAEDTSGNVTFSDTLFITINNINDNAPVASNQEININQELPEGLVVLELEAEDADGDEIFFSIASGNTDDAFEISNDGAISVANSSALIFDTNPVFNLEISLSDGVNVGFVMVTIALNEVAINTAPIFEDQFFAVDENTENGFTIGDLVAQDLEGDALSFSIVTGNTDNAFSITEATGELFVGNSDALDFETTTEFVLLVSVSDGELDETAIITITINDVDEIVLASATAKGVSVYPNPTTEVFSLSGFSHLKHVYLMNAAGEKVKSYSPTSSNTYDISDLAAGVYYIKMEGTNSTGYLRLKVH